MMATGGSYHIIYRGNYYENGYNYGAVTFTISISNNANITLYSG